MNRNVNAISGRLSLRTPQRKSLEILHRITELVPPRSNTPLDEVTTAMHAVGVAVQPSTLPSMAASDGNMCWFHATP